MPAMQTNSGRYGLLSDRHTGLSDRVLSRVHPIDQAHWNHWTARSRQRIQNLKFFITAIRLSELYRGLLSFNTAIFIV